MAKLGLLVQDHDAIDLTDNDISHLTNFPLSPRLRTLLLARNRVAALAPTLGRTIPNLSTLVLTGNRLAELADLDALGGLTRLTHLVLQENPVCAREVRHNSCNRCVFQRWLRRLTRPSPLSTIDIGYSGAVRPCDSSTTRK